MHNRFGIPCAALVVAALIVAPAHAGRIVFTQNYNTIASIGDLAGTSVNQFSALTAGTDGNSQFKIVAQKLHVTKTADASYPSMVATAGNFAYAITNGFVMTFDLAPVAFVTGNDSAVVLIQFQTASGSNVVRIDVKVGGSVAVPQYWLNVNGSGGGNTWNSTSARTITVAVNRTGSDFVYVGPDGASKTLVTGKFDVWFGAGAAPSKLNVSLSSNASIDKLNLTVPGWSSGQGTVSIDSLLIRPLYSPPEQTVILLR